MKKSPGEQCGHVSRFFPSQNSEIMCKQIFIEDVQMDTQTAFMPNGSINIYPCAWEEEKAPITLEGLASYKARITVDERGCTRVRPYNIGSQGSRYVELFATEHCRVLMTQRGRIIERWSFRPTLTASDICALRSLEGRRIDGYYASRRMETRW